METWGRGKMIGIERRYKAGSQKEAIMKGEYTTRAFQPLL
jgi:hypothetical protein